MENDRVRLEKITWDNYREICKLRVTKEQDTFVEAPEGYAEGEEMPAILKL